jgi:hypothetical protein
MTRRHARASRGVVGEEAQAALERVLGRAERSLDVRPPELVLAPRRRQYVAVGLRQCGGARARDRARPITSVAMRTAPAYRARAARGKIDIEGRRSQRTTTQRLLGEVLADDELLAAAGERQPRRGVPVDPVDVVAGLVRARARDVGAEPTPRAVQSPERKPEDASAGDEREGGGQLAAATAASSSSRRGDLRALRAELPGRPTRSRAVATSG